MRVAVFEALPPGGARRVLADLIAATPTSWTYEHFTLGRTTGAPLLSPTPEGTHVERGSAMLDRLGLGGRLAASVLAQRRVAREIDRLGFDLALVNHDAITHTPALLAGLRTPSMFICHEPRRSLVEYPARRRARDEHGMARRWVQVLTEPILGACERRWARSASLIVVNSAFSAESTIRAYGVAPAVWHLGVDPQRFRRVDVVPERPYVLAVGAVEPLKGHHLAVDALGRLPAGARPELHLVGERVLDSYQRELERLAAERGVQLRIRRGVPDQELAAMYSGALATLALGVLEPFGLSTIESIACGTPVIAVREGGYREVVVHGRNGWLIQRSARELSAALEALMSEPTFAPDELRESVLPYWGVAASATRLMELADAMVGDRLMSNDVLEVDVG
jgi:glycosyltransferase involved in cell wall biosynthesis